MRCICARAREENPLWQPWHSDACEWLRTTNSCRTLRRNAFTIKMHEGTRSLAAEGCNEWAWGATPYQPRARRCHTILSAKGREGPLRPCGGLCTPRARWATKSREAMRRIFTTKGQEEARSPAAKYIGIVATPFFMISPHHDDKLSAPPKIKQQSQLFPSKHAGCETLLLTLPSIPFAESPQGTLRVGATFMKRAFI